MRKLFGTTGIAKRSQFVLLSLFSVAALMIAQAAIGDPKAHGIPSSYAQNTVGVENGVTTFEASQSVSYPAVKPNPSHVDRDPNEVMNVFAEVR